MTAPSSEVASEVKKKKCFDNSLCVICQSQSSEVFVANPSDSSYNKLVQCILNRSEWGDEKCCLIRNYFVTEEFSVNSLKAKNGKWHRSCYQLITHKQVCDKLQKKFTENIQKKEKEQEQEGKKEPGHSKEQAKIITRAQITPYVKSKCFFCDIGDTYKEKLRKVATDNAGENLNKAVQLSKNEKLCVRLNAAVNPMDAHAIDVMYHCKCWTKHVTNVLRRETIKDVSGKVDSNIAHTASTIEFIEALSEALGEGKVFDMATLEAAYKSFCSANDVDEKEMMNRKQLKNFIEVELSEDGIEFTHPKRVNEPQRVSVKSTRDALLENIECETDNLNKELAILYQAATILRKKIMNCKRWYFEGSMPLDMKECIPEEVQTFFKWCIKGKCDISKTGGGKCKDIMKKSEVLSQLLMSSCLTDRQLKHTSSSQFRTMRETPLQVAVGLTLHGSTRNKKLIEMFHGLGCSIDYPRVLRLETQIASAVLEKIKENFGIYMPPDIVKGRFIHCAADNLDFCEDTVDGKRTLHGTVMTIYQIKESNDNIASLILKPSNNRSLLNANEALPDMIYFCKPKNWTTCCPEPKVYTEQPYVLTAMYEGKLANLAWLLVRLKFISEEPLMRSLEELDKDYYDSSKTNCISSPTWSGYMSLIGETKPVSKVSMLPLIAASPTDHSVQLTFMKYLENVNNLVLGSGSKVVVTVDMALYKPLKQLEMARRDTQGKWILKPGELHIIIAQLRTIGDFIRGSGISEMWIESNLYGTATAQQILEGKHVRRGLEAHITTFSALAMLLFDEFDQEQSETMELTRQHVANLHNILNNGESDINEAHATLLSNLKDHKILEKLQQFCDEREKSEPVFKYLRTYMDMVETMMLFVKAVRSSNWLLSLVSLKDFVKYFFAMDRQNYAKMISLYLSEMDNLETSEPLIWNEFMQGNWVVNKSTIPFSTLGADEALEHENKRMKMQGGLTGITLNEAARVRFFLADVELTRIIKETENFSGLRPSEERNKHHSSSMKLQICQDKNVMVLKKAFESIINPFANKSNQMVHLVTHEVFPAEVQHDIGRVKDVGKQISLNFIKERIETNSKPFWSPMKKLKLNTCKSAAKKVKLKLEGKVIEMKSNISLFSRLVIASRSRTDIDMKLCISQYEFSTVPKALFSQDGSMRHCLTKYKLAEILENLPTNPCTDTNTTTSCELLTSPEMIAIVDGMAQLHTLIKPSFVKNCEDLGSFFCKVIDDKYKNYSEVHLVFDSYIEGSLKAAIRDHRQRSVGRTQYKILPTTNISNTAIRKLLSHEKTKDELAKFLSEYFIKYGTEHKRKFIVSCQGKTAATHTDVTMLETTQEEADTKILLHAAFVADKGFKTLHIYSPDSDVLILALRRYPNLPPDTGIFLGQGMKRLVNLKPIYDVLGPLKAAALPGLHSLSGCDTTGSFANKGKKSWWNAFQSTTDDVLESLANLGTTPEVSPEIISILEKFVCQVYLPKTLFVDIGDVRWWLFTKKQYQDEYLPPTRGSLQPAIERANLQAMTWQQDLNQFPRLPPPTKQGWKKVEDRYDPVMCLNNCAPSSILEISRCGCKQKRCTQNCSCVTYKLRCTEMCHCSGDPEFCDNIDNINEEDDGDDDGIVVQNTIDDDLGEYDIG